MLSVRRPISYRDPMQSVKCVAAPIRRSAPARAVRPLDLIALPALLALLGLAAAAPLANRQALSVSASAPAAAPAAVPADTAATRHQPAAELVYATTGTVRLGGLPLTLHARTTTHWQFAADHYEASLHTDTIGFDQHSEGGTRPGGGLAPARYVEKRPFHDPESVDIDWANARVRYGTAAPVPAPTAGAQDRLSLQFEMAALYREHPERFAAGTVFAVQLIGTHAIDDWKFVSAGDEAVETGGGTVQAVHLAARRPARDTEETMDLWLAPSNHQMPVRIRMVDRNHSVIDSVLQSAHFE
jgi:hypothetical protein